MNHRTLAATILLVLSLPSGCEDTKPPVVAAGVGAPSSGSGGSIAGTPAPAGAGATAGSTAGTPAPAGAGATAGSTAGATAGSTAGAAAGASGSGTSGQVEATFETVKLVFGGGGGIMPCSAAPCHGVNGVAPPDRPLELPPTDDAQLYANLTSYVSRACNDTKLVTPGNPSSSALITILKGPCGMTPRMPYGCSAEAGDCIPDEYIEAVATWIANGAPRQ